MKKTILTLGIAAALLASCESDDTSDIVINDNSVTNNTTNNNTGGGGEDPGDTTVNLSGVYTQDLTLDANTEYVVTGPVLMASGTTLSIPAGLTIKVQPVGVNAYIAIQQGAQINAVGSASAPIVMTSNASSPGSGDWGGLVICGRAPINSTADGSEDTATSEVGGLSYGGNTPGDNSGTLQYVRIEYAGGAIDGNAELNGLSLYGVGNGTSISYIEIFEGSDDGVEFFGGTVNVSNVAVVNCEDDSIDWTEGYIGSITDVYVQHGTSHDKAFECDGYNTDFSNEGGYFSAPNVTNVTVVGTGLAGNEAIRLRAGTQGIFTNVVVTNFEEAFDLDGDTGDNPTGQGVLDDLLQVIDVAFNGVTTQVKNDTGFTFTDADFLSGVGNGTGTDVSSWGSGWTVGIN
ncbi:multidrug transporter [Robiginitalea sp. SC105]|uniref:multidrug transporter n=1 Tax=Robiginitalea sp. SC105 TaxID=2762332 RepID=UPI001639C027|nr:multidrug transporter [Robiginitalea sp. SC105]MBC2838412.1 multidrug transporter [Robiginitalea sp. SC105]